MHDHHHHHHESAANVSSQQNRIFLLCIVLNLLFVGVEAGIGWVENSLSLLSDAGHNLGDVFSLILVVIGFRLAKMHSNSHYTYGYKKSTILISLLNASILFIAVGAIVIESIHKFQTPTAVDGGMVSWTAAVGIVVNGLTTVLLLKGQRHDLNVRGAFLHMAADTLVSVGVVISGVVISLTGWYEVDPIVSLVIAVVILASTWHLFSDSLRLSLDGMPEGMALERVEAVMRSVEHVVDVHHLHVWAISTTDNALTAHVVIDSIEAMDGVKARLKHALTEAGIGHSTLEFEHNGCHCADDACHLTA